MAITIIGLGPAGWDQVTMEAKDILEKADEVYLRTKQHPAVGHFPKHLKLHSFDGLLETYTAPKDIREAIIRRLVDLAHEKKDLFYAVPGHPLVGDATVQGLLTRAKSKRIAVRMVAGISFLDKALELLQQDPSNRRLQITDVLDLKGDPSAPALLCPLYDAHSVSLAKVALLNSYPPQHTVTLLSYTRRNGKMQAREAELDNLDQVQTSDLLACAYLPPLPTKDDLGSFEALEHIVAKLRAPDGCPWDREQTHTSIKKHLIEEAYEVLQALDEEDIDKLCEELGDLLMQVMLHSQIAAEAQEFDVHDVIRGISTKLIRRHPHVFGDVNVETSHEVLINWEKIKQKERSAETSILASVPKQMPALAYSDAIQRRAARHGFDWEDIEGVLDKLAEEIDELRQSQDEEERLREFGDLLFALVNVARWMGIDPEEALRLANERFYRRFRYIEEAVRKQGKAIKDLTLGELDALWEEAKKRLNHTT